jgi:hypothetical protein
MLMIIIRASVSTKTEIGSDAFSAQDQQRLIQPVAINGSFTSIRDVSIARDECPGGIEIVQTDWGFKSLARLLERSWRLPAIARPSLCLASLPTFHVASIGG